jgi:hypothetical protein
MKEFRMTINNAKINKKIINEKLNRHLKTTYIDHLQHILLHTIPKIALSDDDKHVKMLFDYLFFVIQKSSNYIKRYKNNLVFIYSTYCID